MSDNLHLNILKKLQHAKDDMPDFRPEDWLELDSRLELAEKRKKRRLLLLAALPFLLLLAFNAFLGWKLWHHTHSPTGVIAKQKTTVLYDTIYNKVTVYQYDTIYHTIYRSGILPALKPGGGRNPHLAGGTIVGIDNFNTAITAKSMEAGAPQKASDKSTEGSGMDEAQIYNLDMLPTLAMSQLHHQQYLWYSLFREVPSRHTRRRKLSFLRKGHLSIGFGPALSWREDVKGSNGKSVSVKNEIDLASKRLSWWQEISWNELRLKSERAIKGFPISPSPDPAAVLDKNIFYRRDLGLHTGLAYAFIRNKDFEIRLRLGIGSNLRLGGLHLLDFEDHDTDTHYEITENVSSGWDGWNGGTGLGFIWNATNTWQLHLQGNYFRYLGAGLNDWRIPHWATWQMGVRYRWR